MQAFPQFKNQRAGQILIESIVALSVLIMGLLGLISLLSQSLGLNRVIADNYTGTYLAAEGIEVVKNIVDQNTLNGHAFDTGIASGDYAVDFTTNSLSDTNWNRPLKFDPNTNEYSYTGSKDSIFTRRVTVTLLGSPTAEIKVNSQVTWTTRGNGNFSINLEDHFMKWRP